MQISGFTDYSDVLEPLPPLGAALTNGTVKTSSEKPSSFSDHLSRALSADTAQQPKLTDNSESTGLPLFPTQKPLSISNYPYLNPSRATSILNSDSNEISEEKIISVSKQIEGLLLSLLLKDFGKSDFSGGLFSNSFESSIYHDMFFEELGRSIATDGPGLGIANLIKDDINLKLQVR
ncbi:MAG: rod-binding protein [bacterium]